MDFTEKVENLKNGILNHPSYKVPIMKILNRANDYTAEKKIKSDKEEIMR